MRPKFKRLWITLKYKVLRTNCVFFLKVFTHWKIDIYTGKNLKMLLRTLLAPRSSIELTVLGRRYNILQSSCWTLIYGCPISAHSSLPGSVTALYKPQLKHITHQLAEAAHTWGSRSVLSVYVCVLCTSSVSTQNYFPYLTLDMLCLCTLFPIG